ncbi:MAG: hypothetical protein J5697_04280 [Clostridia bacterium]|nr:hypothetical protein [Clostridia bacterium]
MTANGTFGVQQVSLFEENDLFLTFNYTKTLEKIYSINESSVCHIHGTVNQDIYFGHGDCDNPYESDKFSLMVVSISYKFLSFIHSLCQAKAGIIKLKSL